MKRVSINPGRVEWSGENPGIYLKTAGGTAYSTLALFFRVVLSPFGRGHAAIVLGEPANGVTTYGYDPVTFMQETKVTLCRVEPA